MNKNPNAISSAKLEQKKNTNHITNQNEHFNVKKEALGPNTKQGK